MYMFIEINENKETEVSKKRISPMDEVTTITASSLGEAVNLLTIAWEAEESPKLQSVLESADYESKQSESHYYIAPISQEKAKELYDLSVKEDSEKTRGSMTRDIKRGEEISRERKQIGCEEARNLALRTYAGDVYQTILDSYNLGYYRGYHSKKKESKEG